MVREGGVSTGNLNLRHVARYTIFFADLASRGTMDRARFAICLLKMTGETFRVIDCGVAHNLNVRIVAGDAGDPGVATAPTFALLQTIRLHANAARALRQTTDDRVRRGPMTGSAKIY